MKKIRCPKCDRFVTFDETNAIPGRTLVFVCDYCGFQFRIKLKSTDRQQPQASTSSLENKEGTTAPIASMDEVSQDEAIHARPYLTVVENTFCYRQEYALADGDNLIGRRNKGSEVDIAIDTNDPSMDRRHCFIQVRSNANGEYICTLRDNQSNCGTFLMNEILGPKDRIRLDDGAIITLGATTLIFHLP